ncbi:hypothetical protein GCM10010344_00630 [Streptomyces bluensis]|nr:hypothetical protein GCM10010344_00630 [Streptomyces bluensis]
MDVVILRPAQDLLAAVGGEVVQPVPLPPGQINLSVRHEPEEDGSRHGIGSWSALKKPYWQPYWWRMSYRADGASKRTDRALAWLQVTCTAPALALKPSQRASAFRDKTPGENDLLTSVDMAAIAAYAQLRLARQRGPDPRPVHRYRPAPGLAYRRARRTVAWPPVTT